MNLVLDTNIIRADFRLQSAPFTILLDYLKKTNSRIVMPRLVYEELSAVHRRELLQRIHAYTRARGNLNVLTVVNQVADCAVDPDVETNAYLAELRKRLGFRIEDLHGYRPEYLDDVISRSIHRKRPCNGAGEEIRDAVLWLTVMDIAKCSSNPVAFISSNEKQFAEQGELHSSLQAEVLEHGLNVRYFASLDDFIKQYAVHVSAITPAWLETQIAVDEVLKRAFRRIVHIGESCLENRLKYGERIGEFFELIDSNLTITNFYVYEMLDGSRRIEITYTGEIELSFEVEDVASDLHWELKWEYECHEPPRDRVLYRVVNPDVVISVDAVFSEGCVVSWDIAGVELA